MCGYGPFLLALLDLLVCPNKLEAGEGRWKSQESAGLTTRGNKFDSHNPHKKHKTKKQAWWHMLVILVLASQRHRVPEAPWAASPVYLVRSKPLRDPDSKQNNY